MTARRWPQTYPEQFVASNWHNILITCGWSPKHTQLDRFARLWLMEYAKRNGIVGMGPPA
jgi:hypothetical protein